MLMIIFLAIIRNLFIAISIQLFLLIKLTIGNNIYRNINIANLLAVKVYKNIRKIKIIYVKGSK